LVARVARSVGAVGLVSAMGVNIKLPRFALFLYSPFAPPVVAEFLKLRVVEPCVKERENPRRSLVLLCEVKVWFALIGSSEHIMNDNNINGVVFKGALDPIEAILIGFGEHFGIKVVRACVVDEEIFNGDGDAINFVFDHEVSDLRFT
jgi:hypothetical protein